MSLYPCRHEIRSYDPNADPPIVPWMFIAHVAVVPDTEGIQSGPGFHSGLEWHFYIDKGPGKPEDIITQLRDTSYQADSSYKANGFWKNGQFCGAVSFESEGTGEDAWTDAQCEAIIWLFQKSNEIDRIPLVVCPTWDSQGLGYHRLFSEWNSPYHSCPGDKKVHQFYDVIIPGLTRVPEPEPEPEDEDMANLTICAAEGSGEQFVTDMCTFKRPIVNEDDFNSTLVCLRASGAKVYESGLNTPVRVPVETLNSLPTVQPTSGR